MASGRGRSTGVIGLSIGLGSDRSRSGRGKWDSEDSATDADCTPRPNILGLEFIGYEVHPKVVFPPS